VDYAPADNPQIAIAIVVPNSREGSEVAAPLVRRFFENYFNVGISDFPDWWLTPYVPLTPPQGVGG
jgi:cell division protein FtsI/penicillin-binding protein 2